MFIGSAFGTWCAPGPGEPGQLEHRFHLGRWLGSGVFIKRPRHGLGYVLAGELPDDHALTYAFIIFITVHVYFSVRADYVDRAGVVSSIITGGRFIPANDEYEDYDVEQVPAQPRLPPEHLGRGK